jgi:hypothetical protein
MCDLPVSSKFVYKYNLCGYAVECEDSRVVYVAEVRSAKTPMTDLRATADAARRGAVVGPYTLNNVYP